MSTHPPGSVLMEGPDKGDVALEALATHDYRIAAASDRTGTRLEGPPLASRSTTMSRQSTPMVIGAIELTPSGLIVLGPDPPTTGGYPVIAVVRSASLDTHAVHDGHRRERPRPTNLHDDLFTRVTARSAGNL